MPQVTKYISTFPSEIQERLTAIRNLITTLAPDAEEGFSYGMPAYKTFKKPLVYFAGFEMHIGFYATPEGHEAFKERTKNYKQGKGSIQFPHTEKLPLDLIADMIRIRIQQNELKYNSK